MVKIPRFIQEYANYTKKAVFNSELMNGEKKQKSIKNIDKVLHLTEKGLITIDEGMKLILSSQK